jgi:hypothetical protein
LILTIRDWTSEEVGIPCPEIRRPRKLHGAENGITLHNFMFRTLLLSPARQLRSPIKPFKRYRVDRSIRMVSGGGSGHLNRLASAKSPYLKQHATNPVDWYPFEKAALDKAKRENKVLLLGNVLKKVIFLSIGYSACHWCHVTTVSQTLTKGHGKGII